MRRAIWTTLGLIVACLMAYLAHLLGAPAWGSLIAGMIAYAHWDAEPINLRRTERTSKEKT